MDTTAIDKMRLVGWIAALPEDAEELSRVEAIRCKDEQERNPPRMRNGMLQKGDPGQLDKVAIHLRECLAKARRSANYRPAELDFWERRLWRAVAAAEYNRHSVLELDAETREAVAELARDLGDGSIRGGDDRYYSLRGFMLSAIRSVCMAIVQAGTTTYRAKLKTVLDDMRVESVSVRRVTEQEREADRVLRELYSNECEGA